MKSATSHDSKSHLILFVLLSGTLTVFHWLILALRIPVFQLLPYWMFPLRDTQVVHAWIFAGIFILLVATGIRYSKTSNIMKVIVIFLAGSALQFSFAFSKNHGLDGLRERMVNSGHAEFAIVASQQIGILETVSHYEYIAQSYEYQYIPSKPPGTLLFYVINDGMASAFFPLANNRLDSLQTFAGITWPIFSYVVVFPVYILAKKLFGIETALNAILLYVSAPSINLITLHADQTLYPLLAVIPVLAVVTAFQKNNPWLCLLGGALYYIAVFFSFGLMVAGMLFLVPFFAYAFMEDFPKYLRSSLLLLMATIAGALMMDMLARFSIQYNIYLRYTNAM